MKRDLTPIMVEYKWWVKDVSLLSPSELAKFEENAKDYLESVKQAGRREVVDWIKMNCPDEYASWVEWSVFKVQIEKWGITLNKGGIG